MIKDLLPVLQVILTTCNIIVLVYAGFRFIKRPHDTIEERITELEQLTQSHNSRLKKQEDSSEVFINCMLAFIDFELAYCNHNDYKYTEDLNVAKETLRKHLAKNGGH